MVCVYGTYGSATTRNIADTKPAPDQRRYNRGRGFGGPSKIPLSHFIGKVPKVHLQEVCVFISERSEHPK